MSDCVVRLFCFPSHHFICWSSNAAGFCDLVHKPTSTRPSGAYVRVCLDKAFGRRTRFLSFEMLLFLAPFKHMEFFCLIKVFLHGHASSESHQTSFHTSDPVILHGPPSVISRTCFAQLDHRFESFFVLNAQQMFIHFYHSSDSIAGHYTI